MMTLLFALFLIATGIAWRGNRTLSLWVFAVAMVLSTVWFQHHVGAAVNIDL